MQLLNNYPLPPGACTFCNSNATPVIDTGLSDDDIRTIDLPNEKRGAVYLCCQCGNDVVQLLGGMPESLAKKVQNELTETRNQLELKIAEAESLRVALDALHSAGYSASNEGVVNV